MIDTDLRFMGGLRMFDNPFLLPSSGTMPDTLESALDLCLFLYYLNPQYQQATSRVVRHFITDFDYPDDGSKKEKDSLDDFLHFQLQMPLFMAELGDEWGCYGNGFARIHFPFDRFLVDKRNHTEYSLDLFGRQAKYHFNKLTYEVPDPLNEGKKIELPFRDRKSMDITRIKLRRLNPRFITIQHNLISGSSRYIYRFEPEIVDDVKKGRLWVVNEMPLPMLQAMKANQDFMFDEDAIFHLKAPTVCGVSNAGWGIPGVIANYRNIHQIQVYRKIDEAVGLDYMLPFRLFSPQPMANGTMNDMVNHVIMSRWSQEVRKIIRNRRLDKFAMHAIPFPMNYQEFGHQGKTLTPKDLIEFQTGNLFDGLGYPQELFKGSLTWMQVPTAMRLFENSFMFLYVNFNNFSQWVVKRIRSYLNQPMINIRLQRPSIADSLERKQLIFQLGAQGEISRETAYESLGIDDVVGELKKRMEEDMEVERERVNLQSEFQKQVETGAIQTAQDGAQGDGTTPGGEQAPPGAPTTPTTVADNAMQLAQYWLSIPQPGERAKAMDATRNSDENLFALAKEKMEQMRSQGASQGRQQVGQQLQQQGGPSPGGGGPPGGGQ